MPKFAEQNFHTNPILSVNTELIDGNSDAKIHICNGPFITMVNWQPSVFIRLGVSL